jgi:hypothetical protein
VVILLAETNDLGRRGPTAAAIASNLLQLHRLCHDLGVPHAVALGIPPSGYQAQNPAAASLAAVNANLKQRAEEATLSPSNSNGDGNNGSAHLTVTYVPFPFPYERNGESWSPDALH